MGDYKPTFLVLGVLFPVLASIFVALRIQAKYFKTGKKKLNVAADDWCIFVALIFCYGWTVNNIIDSRLGNLGGHTKLDEHGLPVPDPSFEIFAKTNYASQILAIPAQCLTKISIMILYGRLFNTHRFRFLTGILIAIIAMQMVAFTLACVFQCWPISANWEDPSNQHCVNLGVMYMTGVASNTLTDILTLCWPIFEIGRLRMPFARKLGIMFMFVLGGFVTIIGVLRIYYLSQSFFIIHDPAYYDITYVYSPAIFWTTIEINCGVICACLPLLRPLYRGFHLDNFFTSLQSLVKKQHALHGGRAEASREHGVVLTPNDMQLATYEPMHEEGVRRDSHTIQVV